MGIKIEADCDICTSHINGSNYFKLIIINKGNEAMTPNESIVCPTCIEMLRSFIRNGCPKFK